MPKFTASQQVSFSTHNNILILYKIKACFIVQWKLITFGMQITLDV